MLRKIIKNILTKVLTRKWFVPLGVGLLIFLIFTVRDCQVKKVYPVTSEPALTEVIYRPPLVKLPFTKDKQPVSNADLPIPADMVDKTFEFSIAPSSTKTDFFLVLGKDGKIYGSYPDNVDIVITDWRKKLIRVTLRPAYSMVYTDEIYHCISIDLVSIGKFSIGVDAGANNDFSKYLAGVSARFRMADIEMFFKKKLGLVTLVGWDGFSQRMYFGLSLRW